jgi:hypothetical protein
MKSNLSNRRDFITRSTLAATGLSLGLNSMSSTGSTIADAKDKIRVEFTGTGKNVIQSLTADAEKKSLDISVGETAGVDLLRPVTGGVPLARGAVPEGSRFILLNKSGETVPCQYEVLARWPDRSVRWVLLDFQARPPVNGTENFRLKWAEKARESQPKQSIKVVRGKVILAESGKVQLLTVPGALFRISGRADVKLVLTDRNGQRCEGVVDSGKIETEGKLRTTLALSGSFRTPDGKRVVDFRFRASIYAGLPQIYLEPQILINADKDMIQYIHHLNLEFVTLHPIQSAKIGGSPGWSGVPASGSPVRLFQIDDENYRMEGASGNGSQAPGWLEVNDGKGTMALTLCDFWQQWPKSLEVDLGVVKLGLLPRFEAGSFAHMEPWYKYDFLFDGDSYRLREGQTRRWQVWIDLSGSGETLAKSANMHLVPAADPAQAIDTGEWGYVAPAGTKGMTEYDNWADKLFNGYCRAIHEQRDYGAMSWGDWWGERGCNWGNHEYDTPLHFLLQFARTGDPKYFYVAEKATRHLSEVDVVHFVNPELKKYFSQWETPDYPSRPGMVHEHSIGHVGGFHPVEKIRQLYIDLNIENGKEPYLCLDPFNLGHIFTLGMAHYYLLTGDPWVRETIERIGDNLMRLTEDGCKLFKGWNHAGRTNGWTMLALAGVYKINPLERCLKAMQHIAEDALVEQDPNCGGWLYKLGWGHCNCVTLNHVGEAGFITSVRLNGLSYYHRLTGDDRIPDSLRRAITNLNNDTWIDQDSEWRYTSCPASEHAGQQGVTIQSLVNSVMLTGDQEHLRILRKAWDAKFSSLLEVPAARPGLGKEYSSIMYGSPEAMNLFINQGK